MKFAGMSGGELALVVFILALVLGAHAVPLAFGWASGLMARKEIKPQDKVAKKG